MFEPNVSKMETEIKSAENDNVLIEFKKFIIIYKIDFMNITRCL